MAARNRPRAGLLKDDATDAHEERNMWSQIVTDIKRLKATHAKAADIAKQQVEMEAKMGKCESDSSISQSCCPLLVSLFSGLEVSAAMPE